MRLRRNSVRQVNNRRVFYYYDYSCALEKSVLAATQWDAWSRPSPDLPRELRAKSDLENVSTDPNFEAHLSDFLGKGLMERPNSDLPSALRLMKFKNTANVKRLAAKELKTSNPILSETVCPLHE